MDAGAGAERRHRDSVEQRLPGPGAGVPARSSSAAGQSRPERHRAPSRPAETSTRCPAAGAARADSPTPAAPVQQRRILRERERPRPRAPRRSCRAVASSRTRAGPQAEAQCRRAAGRAACGARPDPVDPQGSPRSGDRATPRRRQASRGRGRSSGAVLARPPLRVNNLGLFEDLTLLAELGRVG